jgi:hypothetical protein
VVHNGFFLYFDQMTGGSSEIGRFSTIRFEAKLIKVGAWTILRLPRSASAKLPSRGIALVEGTINDFPFKAVLEPDGKGSHWFRIDEALSKAAQAVAGGTAVLAIEPSTDWPEPTVPTDLKNALMTASRAHAQWMDITPMARWDWIRWIGSTKQSKTRERRIETACDKLTKGERRPCCFNRNLCAEPYVSHNGILLEPTQEPDKTKESRQRRIGARE